MTPKEVRLNPRYNITLSQLRELAAKDELVSAVMRHRETCFMEWAEVVLRTRQDVRSSRYHHGG